MNWPKQGATTEHRFRYEDLLGSLLGTTDIDGYRSAEYGYTDYGAPLWRKVLFDGQDSRISSLAHSTPSSGYTTINLSGTPLSTDALNGAELVIARPTSAGDRYITATVYDTTSSTIVIGDAGGASGPVYAALNSVTQGFVVFDFNDQNIAGAPSYSSGGKWTSAPAYSAPDTTCTDSAASFAAFQEGWIIEIDAEFPQYTMIAKSRTATTFTIAGDAHNLGASGSRYRAYAPPGVDATNGTLKLDVIEAGSRYLWASYRYMPPQVGYNDAGTTRGAQTGNNKLGQYHCWNREYDPATGRWTTTDAMSWPWWNLQSYSDDNPVSRCDSSGLEWLGLKYDTIGTPWWGSGAFEWRVRWGVKGFVWSSRDLWIVQNMLLRYIALDCTTDQPAIPPLWVNYLEAWSVGAVWPGDGHIAVACRTLGLIPVSGPLKPMADLNGTVKLFSRSTPALKAGLMLVHRSRTPAVCVTNTPSMKIRGAASRMRRYEAHAIGGDCGMLGTPAPVRLPQKQSPSLPDSRGCYSIPGGPISMFCPIGVSLAQIPGWRPPILDKLIVGEPMQNKRHFLCTTLVSICFVMTAIRNGTK